MKKTIETGYGLFITIEGDFKEHYHFVQEHSVEFIEVKVRVFGHDRIFTLSDFLSRLGFDPEVLQNAT